MPQLSIDSAPAIAFAGQIAEGGAPRYSRSAKAEGATLSAGDPVIRGTLPEKDAAPVAAATVITSENFFGFVVLETSRAFDATAMIADEDGVAVLQEGHLYLLASEVVTAGEDVGLVRSTGVYVGLGADENAPTGTSRLPGCKWETTTTAADLAIASIRSLGKSGDFLSMSVEFVVSTGAGVDIAEQIIGAVPEDCLFVGAKYIPAAAVAAGTGATAMNLEINRRTKAVPATQVALAKGSNVVAEAHAWDGDGVVDAWEAVDFTNEAAVSLLAGDVLSFELIAGATPTYPAGCVIVQLRTFA